jgi:hypothetical protein
LVKGWGVGNCLNLLTKMLSQSQSSHPAAAASFIRMVVLNTRGTLSCPALTTMILFISRDHMSLLPKESVHTLFSYVSYLEIAFFCPEFSAVLAVVSLSVLFF